MENVYFAEDIPFMELVFCENDNKLCIVLKSISTNPNADIAIKEVMARKGMFEFCSNLCEDISKVFDFENSEREILSKIKRLKNEISILQFSYNSDSYHTTINELGILSIANGIAKNDLEHYLKENKEKIDNFFDSIFIDE